MKKEVLLKLARASIAEAVGLPYPLDLDGMIQDNPWLKDEGACFVTLTTGDYDMLRGCIGSIVAHRPLYKDLIHNAKSAALNDPRFPSLTKDEFEKITVEVSILTPPQEVEYSSIDDLQSKIRVGIDGVILKHDGAHQATYLPQVWDQLPDFKSFFMHLCMKAGMGMECLAFHPQISIYQVEEYKED
ncbi:AmmeMemoRadiSam system protein A [Sulfurovum sp. zt1-1]|uniref:AmmeMemoRadiSam system protein A n=1 Tax=Sulfurovum zhangzhouensis TaxID=3019067 RepID=A0ABT7QV28_9BACT|nr:AmmeMemoRadiSam system protein A [Sulfurovum zhangzhouensis]MDM5270708.1 AmmeMemoRadiSam system protein A [Sulfurovum zhangzhouensis]